ncbi:MAG: hypothetical protein U0797_23195 [Gemmataceae bacterium]
MSATPDTRTPPPRPPAGPGECLAAEMASDWARGERRPAEHYLADQPALLDSSEVAVRLIYEEVCLRGEGGEGVSAEELGRRFPRLAGELAVMLDCHRLVEARLSPPAFPAPGEGAGRVPPRLRVLGRGARGCVFRDAAGRWPAGPPSSGDQDPEFPPLRAGAATHAHHPPARRLRLPRATCAASASPTSAAPRWRGCWGPWGALRRASVARRWSPPWTRRGAAGSRCRRREAGPVPPSPECPTPRRSVGSAPAWPTPWGTPTSRGCPPRPGSRPTRCSPPTASPAARLPPLTTRCSAGRAVTGGLGGT